MLTGIITPIPHLEEYARGNFHLTLAHLYENRQYRDFYTQQAAEGSFVLLDNSAHEKGAGGQPGDLISLAMDVGVRELVCPDVLFDDVGTVHRTTEALMMYGRPPYREIIERETLRLMMVPQATTIYRYGRCLAQLIKAHQTVFKGIPFTIGISKDYEMWVGGLMNLMRRFIEPARRQYNFDVHLLGWGRDLWALPQLSNNFPWIRSTDSAKPLVYAAHGIPLEPTNIRYGRRQDYPGRPRDFFHTRFEGLVWDDYAEWNITVFKALANVGTGSLPEGIIIEVPPAEARFT